MGELRKGFLAIFLLLSACTSGKRINNLRALKLQKQIEHSEIFSKNFTGFSLMDATTGEYLYGSDADKYFTPASNTKIFTLYTCLHILGDSIPALRYEIRGDSLLFWGTGDPSLLNPNMGNNRQVIQFLTSRPERLFFCPYNFQDKPFGAGWAWDDYNYYFQPEKSVLPIYGNVVTFKKEANALQYEVEPNPFTNALVDNPQLTDGKARVIRRSAENIFEYNVLESIPYAFHSSIPFRYSDPLLLHLLELELKKPIEIYPEPLLPSPHSQMLYSEATTVAYRQMMQESDNFISEQLLLLCANQVLDTLNTKAIIDYAQEKLLSEFPDPVLWVDGSGLSRYNLFTPRSISHLLYKIYQHTSLDYLQEIFPAGGQSGTIKDWYGGGEMPYVYAKTGTLSNKHCLSGYLVAQSGKLLIFSFMHNNYTTGSRGIKEEMEKILRNLYLQY